MENNYSRAFEFGFPMTNILKTDINRTTGFTDSERQKMDKIQS